MKIDWRVKLSSRKLWVAIVGLATSVMMVLGASDSDTSKIVAAITALGSVVSYILGESIVDAGRNSDKEENKSDNIET